jgi:hypothetical protein
MSQQRYNELDANGGTLTPAEQAEGWHFCPEFDGLLTMGEGPGPCPCGIHGDSPLQLTRDPEPHGTRDTFVPPKCDDDFIREFEAALDKVTIEALSTTNNTMMTPSRWLQLTMNGGHITPLERMEGWHYCPRLDDKLTKMQNNLCKLCGADQLPDPLELVVCPPVKSDIELLREKLISMDAITEIDLGEPKDPS